MGQIVHASWHQGNEGPGDQTGTEVKVSGFYNGGWNVVMRCKNASIAQKATAAAVKLARSNLVGYSMNSRALLRTCLQKYNYDVDKYIASGEKSNADCSSFIHICYEIYIEALRSMYCSTTSTIPGNFGPLGFERLPYTGEAGLQLGDIVDNTSEHVVFYIGDESKLNGIVTAGSGGQLVEGETVNRYEKKDSILREIFYFASNLSPSISQTYARISVYNSAIYQVMMIAAEGGSNSYNYDKIQPPNARTCIQFLLGKGLNLAGAIGICANIWRESNFDTAAVNPSSGASGICQWLYTRKTSFLAYVGAGWRTDLSRQLEYLWYELNAGYKSCLDKIQAVPDTLAGAKQASHHFLYEFEKPGNITYEDTLRQSKAEEFWKHCSITQTSSGGGNGAIPTGSPKKTVAVPSSVPQTGIIPNYTNYGYWFSRWGYTQRKIADEWGRTGKQHNEYVATISGYRLIAISPIFGTTGDLVKVNLEGGNSFGAIIADSKGGDAGSPYGHYLGGAVDIVEWEMAGNAANAVDSVTQSKMVLTGLRGKKVTSIENYGQYKQW